MTKQRYRIREGVETINGTRVPENRVLEMSRQAAYYYVSIGVAALEAKDEEEPVPRKSRSKASTKPEA